MDTAGGNNALTTTFPTHSLRTELCNLLALHQLREKKSMHASKL